MVIGRVELGALGEHCLDSGYRIEFFSTDEEESDESDGDWW